MLVCGDSAGRRANMKCRD